MKVNSKQIIQLRKDKLWSQEQLAQACGLGLRTIQRIENTGNASAESIQAIASVFEVIADSLVIEQTVFEDYHHTQIGYAILIIFLVILSVIYLPIVSSLHAHGGSSLLAVSLSTIPLIVIAALFSSLSISIDKNNLKWSFTFNFWKKQLKIDEIASCQVVKNSILSGLGIRMLSHGWLYNVSGIMAVEVVLKSGDIVRLGTDEPEYLKQAIENAIIYNAQQQL